MSRMSVLSLLALLALVAAATGLAGSVVASDALSSDAVSQTTGGPGLSMVRFSDTANYLSIDAPARQSYSRVDVDVTAASGMGAQRLHARHATMTFDERFRKNANETARLALVRSSANRLEDRLDRLDARQQALFGQYSNGTLSRETVLRRLARLSVRAEQTGDTLEHIEQRVDATPGVSMPVSLDTRISELQSGLLMHPRPVTERITATFEAQQGPVTVYAEGGDGGDGLVLAAVDAGDFVRQATLRSEYAPEEPDQFERADQRAITVALDRGQELYPWVYNNSISFPQIGPSGDKSYLITVNHVHGSLRTYIHGGTRNVYHELQELRPETVPVTDSVTAVNNSLELRVEQTSRTGPMRVSLTRPDSETPVDGQISIGGQPVGQTGTNGRLWTVQPASGTPVNATVGDQSVELSVA